MSAIFHIIFSKAANKYYVGHTTETVEERLRKHHANHKGFTGKFSDWIVVHTDSFPTKSLAYAREMKVKAWKSRIKIEQLIRSGHPDC